MSALINAAVRTRPPGRPLRVPAELALRIDAAVALAARRTASWLRAHPRGDAWEFAQFVSRSVARPPAGAAERQELRLLHVIQRHRRAGATRRAKWFQDNADMRALWVSLLKAPPAHAGRAQAAGAVKLLDAALETAGEAVDIAKDRFSRARPYSRDPSVRPALPRDLNPNRSYPSGHTSAGFAGAIAVAALIPQRAGLFLQLAKEMAYSRVYGGVHYPSDVVAGAYLGAMAGWFAVAQAARQKL